LVPNIGFSELIVILMILLLVFGASRLPQIGESLGRTVRGFKRGLSTDEQITITRGEAQPDVAAKAVARTSASDIAEAEVIDDKG
jgi:sec-independent protein translocase protein TatA